VPDKVLVVEDDSHTRRLFALALERLLPEAEVLLAADGQEGLALFDSENPDVVVTDLLMPKMDGFQLVRAIRKRLAGVATPILVTSAVIRNEQTLRRLRHEFMVEVQNKPINPQHFTRLIRQMLARRKQQSGKENGTHSGVKVEGASASRARPTAAKRPVAEELTGPHRLAPARSLRPRFGGAAGTLPPSGPPTKTAQAWPINQEIVVDLPDERIAAHKRQQSEPSVEQDVRVSRGHKEVRTSEHPSISVSNKLEAVMSGEVADTPVAGLLLECHREQRTGRLILRQGRMRKDIYLQAGCPIYVRSNQRAESLGELLLKRRRLDEEQHHQALIVARRRDLSYAESLTELGFLSKHDALVELDNLAKVRLRSCLRWQQGSFRLLRSVGARVHIPRHVIDLPLEVFTGLANQYDTQRILTELQQSGLGRKIRVGAHFALYVTAFRAAFGDHMVRALELEPMLSALLETHDPAQVALSVDAMLRCNLGRLAAPKDPAAMAKPSPIEESDATVEVPSLDFLTEAPGSEWAEAETHAGDLDATGSEAALPPRRRLGTRPGVRLTKELAASMAEQNVGEQDKVAIALVESAYLGLREKTHYEVLGVIPETDEHGVEVAYRLKRRQFSLERFRERDLGAAYERLEEICAALDEAFFHLGDVRRRAAYDQRLADVKRWRNATMEAETCYAEGATCLAKGEYARAEQLFGRAIELDDQAEYRVQEALAHFHGSGGDTEAGIQAMVRLQAVLADSPTLVAAHVAHATVSKALGAEEEALAHLKEALRLDPTSDEAFEGLEALLLEQQAFDQLEQAYRRAIAVIDADEEQKLASFWKRLAFLYRDHLEDPHRTRKALETAYRYAPRDKQVGTALLHLDAGSSSSWPAAVLGHRALLQTEPDSTAPLLTLYDLHRRANRDDAARVAASIALSRGSRRSDLLAFVQGDPLEGRSLFGELAAASVTLDEAFWLELAHPSEDPYLTRLYRTLDPLIRRVDPLAAGDLGLLQSENGEPDAERVVPELTALCQLLHIPHPRVTLAPELAADVQSLPCDPPVLLVGGSDLDDLQSRARRTYLLARALVLLVPGRRVAVHAPALLRDVFVAAVGVVYPELAIAPSSQRVVALEEQLGRSGLDEDCAPLIQAIHDRGKDIDLPKWQVGIQRSAERAALLLCGDVRAACDVTRDISREAEQELVDFALGQGYDSLSAQLRSFVQR
jgi:CheY-like chemotaxis protein/tetratricopeptide (TPR) repeat protein